MEFTKICLRGSAITLLIFVATTAGTHLRANVSIDKGNPQQPAVGEPGLVLLDRLVNFFRRTGQAGASAYDAVQPPINELMQMARQSLAGRQIDQEFFDRYARILRLILLASIPDQGEVLLPTTSREFNSFIRDVTGKNVDASGASLLRELSSAMATEIDSLRKLASAVPGGITAPRVTPTGPVRVGPDIKPPERLKHVEPVYPAMAKTAKVQGLVMIDATIGKDGKVTQAKVVQGVPLLDEAALAAVKQWVYAPTLIGGVPVDVVMTVTVSFAIR
jgi:protein TonB